MRFARACAGLLLGLVARIWLATLRVEVRSNEALAGLRDRPWILAFFHGTQWPLLAWHRRRPTWVLVSLSVDGTMQARALSIVGLSVVRGSSSRGAVRGLARLTRALRKGGGDGAFAVDGPRGPYGVAKGGARVAARAVGGVLVPMGAASARETVLTRSWDRFSVAWPFSRVVVCLGAPIEPGDSTAAVDAELGRAIESANRCAADTMLRGSSIAPIGPSSLGDPGNHHGGMVDRTK